MAVYTNDLRLKEIGTGDESGTWGVSTNTNLSLIADGFSYGTLEVAADSNETFTMPDGTADNSRCFYLKFTSAGSLTATRTLTLGPNTISKVWTIENATSGSQSIVISQGSGATVTIENGATAVIYTDGAGAGAAVVNALTSTQFVTPILGTPTSGTLTNATGLPISTGVSGLGTGVATWLATPSSTNFRAVMTDETGTGSLVFATSPTLVTPILGTPTSGTLTNATGLPLSTGVTGTLPVANGGTGITAIGTGVATAWGVDIGSAGAMVTFNGALGTPSSGTATNLTGLPLSTGVTGTLPVANGGTAATTAAGARASILNSFAGNAGYALVVNVGETDTEWAVTPGVGSVTSVDVSGGTTGLTTSGGPITAAGTITLAGTLAVANGGTGVTASTGTGSTVLSTSPTLVTPLLGTPTSGTLTNCTGLPIAGTTGYGTGVATALAVNVGSAGAPVLFDGALGTPSSGNLANCTGYPSSSLEGTQTLSTGTDATLNSTDLMHMVTTTAADVIISLADATDYTAGTECVFIKNDGTYNFTLVSNGSGVSFGRLSPGESCALFLISNGDADGVWLFRKVTAKPNFGDWLVASSASTSKSAACRIADNKILAVYVGTTSYGYMVVITETDGVLSAGSEVAFDSETTRICACCGTDAADEAIVINQDSGYDINAHFITVSGTVPSVANTRDTITAASSNSYISVCKAATDKYVVGYGDNSTYPYAIAFTTTGTTINAPGTAAAVFGSNAGSYFRVRSSGVDDYIFFVWSNGGTSSYLSICSLSSTTITVGSIYTFDTGADPITDVVPITTTLAVGMTYFTDATFGNWIVLESFTWTGTTGTFASSLTLLPGYAINATLGAPQISLVAPNLLLIIHPDYEIRSAQYSYISIDNEGVMHVIESGIQFEGFPPNTQFGHTLYGLYASLVTMRNGVAAWCGAGINPTYQYAIPVLLGDQA